MSEHEPRAYIHCHAYGCKLHGSMARSTSGTNEWFCSIHFGAEPDDWQAITAELNRLSWLVEVSKKVRANQMNAGRKWRDSIDKELRLAQRGDLCWNGSESMGTWSARLEKVLRDSCAAVIQSAPVQQPIPEV